MYIKHRYTTKKEEMNLEQNVQLQKQLSESLNLLKFFLWLWKLFIYQLITSEHIIIIIIIIIGLKYKHKDRSVCVCGGCIISKSIN